MAGLEVTIVLSKPVESVDCTDEGSNGFALTGDSVLQVYMKRIHMFYINVLGQECFLGFRESAGMAIIIV